MLNTETAEAERGEGRKKRGASYPTLSLASAAKVIHDAGQHGMEHSVRAFAGYCGHTTANSGAFRQKLSAFKDWRLISANGDRLTITDAGKAFVLAEDPLLEVQVLREVFLSCKIMHDFYDDVAKGKANKPDTLKRQAIANFRVSADTAQTFLKSLIESAVAAELATVDEATGEVTFLAPIADDGENDLVDDSSDDASDSNQTDFEAAPPNRITRRTNVAPAVLRQVWATKSGEVVLSIHSHDPLSADAFTLVAKAVQAVAAIAENLGRPERDSDDGTS